MKETNNHLEFKEKPKYHTIVVFGEEKSEELFTKVQALKKITELANAKKILPADFAKMRDEILQEDSLPWEEKGPRQITIEVHGPGFGFPPPDVFDELLFGFGPFSGNPFSRGRSRNPFAVLGEMEMISGVLEAIMGAEEPVEKPTFVPCKCGDKHGKIRTKEWTTNPLDSKGGAMMALGGMLERKIVTKEEAGEVEKQITEFFTEKPAGKPE